MPGAARPPPAPHLHGHDDRRLPAPGRCGRRSPTPTPIPGADTIAVQHRRARASTRSRPASALPTITGPVTIDGYTQPGASREHATDQPGPEHRPQIEIDGHDQPAPRRALERAGRRRDDPRPRDQPLPGASDILTTGAHQDFVVEGCFLGTERRRNPGRLEPYGGAAVTSRNHTNARIGGTTPAARNLISGNASTSTRFSSARSAGTPTAPSSPATSSAPTSPAPSALRRRPNVHRIFGVGRASNMIGGTTAAARNVLVAARSISADSSTASEATEQSRCRATSSASTLRARGRPSAAYAQCIAVDGTEHTPSAGSAPALATASAGNGRQRRHPGPRFQRRHPGQLHRHRRNRDPSTFATASTGSIVYAPATIGGTAARRRQSSSPTTEAGPGSRVVAARASRSAATRSSTTRRIGRERPRHRSLHERPSASR